MRIQARGVPAIVAAGAIVATLVLFPTTGVGAVGESLGPSRTSADQTYVDATGDSKGRLDVTTVRASSSGNRLDIRVSTREQTINSNEHIWIDIDTNLDGTRDIGFYFRGGGAGTLRHTRYGNDPLNLTPDVARDGIGSGLRDHVQPSPQRIGQSPQDPVQCGHQGSASHHPMGPRPGHRALGFHGRRNATACSSSAAADELSTHREQALLDHPGPADGGTGSGRRRHLRVQRHEPVGTRRNDHLQGNARLSPRPG